MVTPYNNIIIGQMPYSGKPPLDLLCMEIGQVQIVRFCLVSLLVLYENKPDSTPTEENGKPILSGIREGRI